VFVLSKMFDPIKELIKLIIVKIGTYFQIIFSDFKNLKNEVIFCPSSPNLSVAIAICGGIPIIIRNGMEIIVPPPISVPKRLATMLIKNTENKVNISDILLNNCNTKYLIFYWFLKQFLAWKID